MRLFKRKNKNAPISAEKIQEPVTLESISQKLQNYTATQGRASFSGTLSYSAEEVEELSRKKTRKAVRKGSIA